jgi:hypothetical protein
MKIFHPPLIPPINGWNVPSPLVGEGLGEGYFRINTITQDFRVCAISVVIGSNRVIGIIQNRRRNAKYF